MFHGFHFRPHTDSTIGKLIRQEFIYLILPIVCCIWMASTFNCLLIMSFAYRSFSVVKCSTIMLFNMHSFTCVRLGTETMMKGWCGLVRYLVSYELLWNDVTYRTARANEALRERVELFFNYHLLKHNIVTKDINKTTQGKTESRLLALSAFMMPSEPWIRSTPVLSGDVFVRSDVISLGVSVIDECVFGLQFSLGRNSK